MKAAAVAAVLAAVMLGACGVGSSGRSSATTVARLTTPTTTAAPSNVPRTYHAQPTTTTNLGGYIPPCVNYAIYPCRDMAYGGGMRYGPGVGPPPTSPCPAGEFHAGTDCIPYPPPCGAPIQAQCYSDPGYRNTPTTDPPSGTPVP